MKRLQLPDVRNDSRQPAKIFIDFQLQQVHKLPNSAHRGEIS
jgi:hypothetical protein